LGNFQIRDCLLAALPANGRTLFLIVPTKTQAYEDDKENRIRIRYAIERALFDQGYAAEDGNLLSTIEIGPAPGDKEERQASRVLVQTSTSPRPGTKPATHDHSLPIQIFRLCPSALPQGFLAKRKVARRLRLQRFAW
jgi:hypothetical protein